METLLQFKDQDLTILRQEAACGKYYHGHGNIILQIEKFVGGKGKCSNFWIVEDTSHGPLRIIPQTLHRQRRQIFAADKNVTVELLSRSSLTKAARVSGQTIRTNAMATIRFVKKMLSLVDEAVKENIPAKEGTEYDFCSSNFGGLASGHKNGRYARKNTWNLKLPFYELKTYYSASFILST